VKHLVNWIASLILLKSNFILRATEKTLEAKRKNMQLLKIVYGLPKHKLKQTDGAVLSTK